MELGSFFRTVGELGQRPVNVEVLKEPTSELRIRAKDYF
jgi:hypothetical protein